MTIAETGRGRLLQPEHPDAERERFLGGDLPESLDHLLVDRAPTALLRVIDEAFTDEWLVTVAGLAARIERRSHDGPTTSYLTASPLLPLAVVHEFGLGDRGPEPWQPVVASRRWLLGTGGRRPSGVGTTRFLFGDPTGTVSTVVLPAEPSGYVLGMLVGEAPDITLVPATGLDVWHQLVISASRDRTTTAGPVSSPPG